MEGISGNNFVPGRLIRDIKRLFIVAVVNKSTLLVI